MKTNQVDCKNCEKPFTVGFKFCPNCGQKTNEELTIGVLFYNTICNYFSFDARFFKSFVPLMIKPGYLAKRFIEGKRMLYLHPAQMYLFVSILFFFIFSFTVSDWKTEADILNQRMIKTNAIDELIESSNDSLSAEQLSEISRVLDDNKNILDLPQSDLKQSDSILVNKKEPVLKTVWDFNKAKIDSLIASNADDAVIYKEMGMPADADYFTKRIFKTVLNVTKGTGVGSIIQSAFDAVPISMFILLPLFAFILKLFYYKSGNYAYHLVFSFYFFAFLFALFSILLLVNRFLFEIPALASWLIVLSTCIYFYLSVLKFYEHHWFWSLLKSGIITMVFTLFVIPTAITVLFIFAFLNN
jgi:hypothetical protein